MINQDQFKEVKNRVEAIESYLKIPAKRMELSEQELKTQDPDFWNDPKDAEIQMKKIRGIKIWIESFDELDELTGDLEVLIDFAREGEATEEEVTQKYDLLVEKIEELELKNMLSGEEDALDAVLQITAGAGGTESCDWASMLMRMYIMWGQKNGYKVKELNYQEGDVAGIKTVTLEFSGDFAFGYLKGENGVHRLVELAHLTRMRKDILLLHRSMFIHLLMIQLKSILTQLIYLSKLLGQEEKADRM